MDAGPGNSGHSKRQMRQIKAGYLNTSSMGITPDISFDKHLILTAL